MKRRNDLFSSSIDGASNGSFSFFLNQLKLFQDNLLVNTSH